MTGQEWSCDLCRLRDALVTWFCGRKSVQGKWREVRQCPRGKYFVSQKGKTQERSKRLSVTAQMKMKPAECFAVVPATLAEAALGSSWWSLMNPIKMHPARLKRSNQLTCNVLVGFVNEKLWLKSILLFQKVPLACYCLKAAAQANCTISSKPRNFRQLYGNTSLHKKRINPWAESGIAESTGISNFSVIMKTHSHFTCSDFKELDFIRFIIFLNSIILLHSMSFILMGKGKVGRAL